MTTRLLLYNEALLMCGETRLASLSENREPRHLLDHVWDNGGVKACLESGQWKFAMRSVRLDYDTDVAADFGFNYSFEKPSDWCATSALCSDEYFKEPLIHYADENGFWYCDLTELYVRFVSNDSAWGNDLSLWPAKFADYVAAHFASKIILKLSNDKDRQKTVFALLRKKQSEAKNHDAMSDPVMFPPTGSWNRARSGRSSRRDRGNRGSLTG